MKTITEKNHKVFLYKLKHNKKSCYRNFKNVTTLIFKEQIQ